MMDVVAEFEASKRAQLDRISEACNRRELPFRQRFGWLYDAFRDLENHLSGDCLDVRCWNEDCGGGWDMLGIGNPGRTFAVYARSDGSCESYARCSGNLVPGRWELKTKELPQFDGLVTDIAKAESFVRFIIKALTNSPPVDGEFIELLEQHGMGVPA